MDRAICLISLVLATLPAAFAQSQPPREPHVIVIGVDGLSVDGVNTAPTPRLHELMTRAAWTLEARGVMPTLSSPNWESIIGGAPPEQHGITSNGYFRRLVEFPPACHDQEGKFPTIFGLLRDQKPGSRIAVFHEWGGFANLVEHRGPDVMKHESTSASTVKAAIEYWKANRPTLLFVHLDGVDHAGHESNWFSSSYYRAVAEADGYVGEILNSVAAEGAADSTFILVTSDHGGTKHGHGKNSLAEIQIPWILAGPGLKPGELSVPVNTYDTAVTLAWLFGLETPQCWTGRPVLAAFEPAFLLSKAGPEGIPPRGQQAGCTPTQPARTPVTGAAVRLSVGPENQVKARP
jgi:predicted AlkP superfamily pyrophosphatase or phosphodiesterase